MELIRQSGPKGEGQRYAGALVLRELAVHAPAVLYARRHAFFEDVWLIVNDFTVRNEHCVYEWRYCMYRIFCCLFVFCLLFDGLYFLSSGLPQVLKCYISFFVLISYSDWCAFTVDHSTFFSTCVPLNAIDVFFILFRSDFFLSAFFFCVKSAVRVRAAAALGAMLQLVHERQSTPTFSRLVLDKVDEGALALPWARGVPVLEHLCD